MSRYDEMSTAGLIAESRASTFRVGTSALATALTDRLAAYERIVAGLHDVAARELTDAFGECVLCGGTEDADGEKNAWSHTPDCPWALAQQTGSGK